MAELMCWFAVNTGVPNKLLTQCKSAKHPETVLISDENSEMQSSRKQSYSTKLQVNLKTLTFENCGDRIHNKIIKCFRVNRNI